MLNSDAKFKALFASGRGEKENHLKQVSALKKEQLVNLDKAREIEITPESVKDADSLLVPNETQPGGVEELRFGNPEGYSNDAWETKHELNEFDNQRSKDLFVKKMARQRGNLAAYKGVPGNTVTDEDVNLQAQGSIDYFNEVANQGQNTFNAEVDTGDTEDDFPTVAEVQNPTGKTGYFGRQLVKVTNPYVGEYDEETGEYSGGDLVRAMNLPEHNSDFSNKWKNPQGILEQRQRDILNKRAGQEGSKALISNDSVAYNPVLNAANKGLYMTSTVASIATGGVNFVLEGADLATDDPEQSANLRSAQDWVNSVNQSVSGWVNRSKLNAATADIQGEVKATAESYRKTIKAFEDGDTSAAVGHTMDAVVNFGGAAGKFITEHPDAAADVFFESIPQMYVAAKHLIGGGMLIATRYFNDNVEAYKKEHGGQEPTGDQKGEILLWSMAQSGAETASAKFSLGPLIDKGSKARAAAARIPDVTKKIVAETTEGLGEAAKQGKVALARKALGLPLRAAKATVKTGATTAFKVATSKTVLRGANDAFVEGGTEGLQTYIEERTKHLDQTEKIEAENVITGAVLGMGVGGGIGVVTGAREDFSNAFGTQVQRAGEVAREAKAKASGVTKQFTNDRASKRDPEKAFEMEQTQFKNAESQEEAFTVIGDLEKHAENFAVEVAALKAKEEALTAQIETAGPPTSNEELVIYKQREEEADALLDQVIAAEERLVTMRSDIVEKTTAAKYRKSPVEDVQIEQAYSNLSDDTVTEYKSEDIDAVIADIIYGSEDFKGSGDTNKVLRNKKIPEEVRKLIIEAKNLSKSLLLYDEVKRENNYADVRNDVAGNTGTDKKGARWYADTLANTVARRDKDKMDKVLELLKRFQLHQKSKQGIVKEKLDYINSRNEKIQKLKDNNQWTKATAKKMGAKKNPIPVSWDSKLSDEEPFMLRARKGAGEDKDLYYTKGLERLQRMLKPEVDTLAAIHGVFEALPKVAFKGKIKKGSRWRTDQAEKQDSKTADAEDAKRSRKKGKKKKKKAKKESKQEESRQKEGPTEKPKEGSRVTADEFGSEAQPTKEQGSEGGLKDVVGFPQEIADIDDLVQYEKGQHIGYYAVLTGQGIASGHWDALIKVRTWLKDVHEYRMETDSGELDFVLVLDKNLDATSKKNLAILESKGIPVIHLNAENKSFEQQITNAVDQAHYSSAIDYEPEVKEEPVKKEKKQKKAEAAYVTPETEFDFESDAEQAIANWDVFESMDPATVDGALAQEFLIQKYTKIFNKEGVLKTKKNGVIVMQGKKYRNKQGKQEQLRNYMNQDLYDFYSKHGWPTAADTNITPGSVRRSGKTLSDLYKAAKKNPKSVLGKIPDFMYMTWMSNPDDRDNIQDFADLQGITEEDGDMVDAIEHLEDLHDKIEEALEDIQMSPETGKKFVKDSAYIMFQDKHGNFLPNVVTAMTVAAMTFMLRNSSSSLDRTDEAMTDFLGLSPGIYLTDYKPKMIKTVREAGLLTTMASNSIGMEVLRQLNMQMKGDQVVSLDANVQGSLGILTLGLMEQIGLIEQNRIKRTDLVKMDNHKKKGNKPVSDKFKSGAGDIKFVRVSTNQGPEGGLWKTQEVSDLVNASTTYAPVFAKLFDINVGDLMPEDAPITEVETNIRSTSTRMPKQTAKSVKYAQKVAWYRKGNMFDQLNRFPTVENKQDDEGNTIFGKMDHRLAIFGGKDPKKAHITAVDSIVDANAALAREWQDANDYYGSRKKANAAMYFKYHQVVNTRIMLANQMLNYQSSKFQRWSMASEKWHRIVDVSNFSGNKSEELKGHLIAIAEAFGKESKNMTPDEQLDFVYDNLIDEDGNLHSTYEGVDLQRVMTLLTDTGLDEDGNLRKYSQNQAKAIAAVVKKGGEGSHTFAGLMALAELYDGIQNKDENLSINLAREIDGVTNGVISAMMQLVGKNARKIIERGGGRYAGSIESHTEWSAEPTNKDNYEEIARLAHLERGKSKKENKRIGELSEDEEGTYVVGYAKRSNAVYDLLGDFATVIEGQVTKITGVGRELHKDPLLTLIYGIGLGKVSRNLQDSALQTFYDNLAKNYDNRAELTKMFTAIKTIDDTLKNQNLSKQELARKLSRQGFPSIRELSVEEIVDDIYKDLEFAQEWTFDAEEAVFFKQEVGRFYGKPLKNALTGYLGDFMEMRSAMNSTGDFMNRVFVKLWDREKAKIRLKKHREYTLDEEKAFINKMQKKGLLPGIRAALSDRVGSDGLTDYTDYIQTTKKERKPLPQSNQNSSTQVYFKGKKKGFKVNDLVSGEVSEGNSAKTGAVVMDYIEDLGVKFFPLINQAMDSAIIQALLADQEIQNIYDAFAAGSMNADKFAYTLNKAFYEQHKAWGMVKEVELAAKRALAEFNNMAKKDKQDIVKPMIRKARKSSFLFTPDLELEMDPSKGILPNFTEQFKGELIGKRFQKWKKDKDANLNQLSHISQFPTLKGGFHTGNFEAKEKADPDTYSDKEFGSESTRNFKKTKDPELLTADVAQDVFKQLKDIGNIHDSAEHQAYLEQALNNDILPVMATMDDFILHLGQTKTGQRHVGSVKGQNIYVGANAGIQNTNSNPSPQEIYIHELYHGVLSWGINNTPKMKNEVRRLFEAAERDPNVTWKAFLRKDADPNNADEITEAKRKYDYVFDGSIDGYLHEFASFGLSNEAFMAALAKVDVSKTYSIFTGTLPERIANIIGYIANSLKTLTQGSQPANARDALIQLSKNINGINSQALSKTDQYWSKSWSKVNTVAKSGMQNYVWKPYVKSVIKLQQGIVKKREETNNAPAGFVQKYFITPYILPKEIIYDNFLGSLTEIAYEMGLTMDTVAHHFFTEVRGPTIKSKKYYKFLREGKHAIDANTEARVGTVTSILNDGFTRKLSDKEWMSLTSGVLKPDLVDLVGTYSMQDIRNMLASPGAANTQAAAVKATIMKLFPTNGAYYINQAKSLGGFMASGKDGLGMGMHNAYTIANMQNVERFGYEPEGDLTKAEDLIDRLATIQAVISTPRDAKKDVVKIMDEEFQSGVETNGIDLLFKLHKQFKEDSLKMLFNDNKNLMMKGWTRELYDEYKSFKIGTKEQALEYEEEGYVRQPNPIKQDKNFKKTTPQYIYISKDGLTNRRVTGAMGLTNKIGKGHDIVSAAYQEILTKGETEGTTDPYKLVRIRHANYEKNVLKNVHAQFKGEMDMDYSNNWLVPLLNGAGDIHTYRYTMSEQMKVNELGKRDLANAVMGRMQGALIAKPATTKQNKTVLEYAYEDYKKNYSGDKRSFVHIGPNIPAGLSKRERRKWQKYKDLYYLLPTDTDLEIERIWGKEEGEGFYIREDLMYLIGGFRKASFTNWVDDNTGGILPSKMKHVMRLSGIIWAEVVKTGKRNLILFLPEIVTENTYSNTLFLMFRGVPPQYAVSHQIEAVQELLRYQKDMQTMHRLKTMIDIDPNNKHTAARQRNLERLQLNMKNSPTSKLIDAGLFQSLSEDLATSSAKEYESGIKKAIGNAVPIFEEMIDATEGKIPPSWEEAYNLLSLDPSVPLAQAIAKATQYSDFVARYTLFKWRTEQQKDRIPEGMTSDAWAELAIEEAQDVFVNYDDPTSPELQWLNDMGVIMFTKYMFRMMRVVTRTFKDNPGRVIGMKMLEDALIDGQDVFDSSVLLSKDVMDNMMGPLHHIGNAATPNGLRFGNGLVDMFFN